MDLVSYKRILNTSSTAAKCTLKSIMLLTELTFTFLIILCSCKYLGYIDTQAILQFSVNFRTDPELCSSYNRPIKFQTVNTHTAIWSVLLNPKLRISSTHFTKPANNTVTNKKKKLWN